mmetsp:Transcript_10951/g.29380  ORF Transcript_10951/g.29380 Transcript_10951/m.29380 type:complete len:215 (+) Transcript_10951:1704-2348(+)
MHTDLAPVDRFRVRRARCVPLFVVRSKHGLSGDTCSAARSEQQKTSAGRFLVLFVLNFFNFSLQTLHFGTPIVHRVYLLLPTHAAATDTRPMLRGSLLCLVHTRPLRNFEFEHRFLVLLLQLQYVFQIDHDGGCLDFAGVCIVEYFEQLLVCAKFFWNIHYNDAVVCWNLQTPIVNSVSREHPKFAEQDPKHVRNQYDVYNCGCVKPHGFLRHI